MDNTRRIDELNTKPIKPLLWQYALPAIIGSSVNALYNIIGRYFVGNAPYLGDTAMTAMGIALPIMIIITAFGMLVGAGAASRISIYLGQGANEKAERVLGNALVLTLILTLTVSLLLSLFLDPVVTLLGANSKTHQYTYDFLRIFIAGCIFSTLCFTFSNMMRASGYPRRAMYIMLLTLVINGVLAPVFIYGFKWGIKGASLATVIAMFAGTCCVFYHFLYASSTLRLRWKNIGLDSAIVKAILSIGMSPFLMQLVASTVVFLVIYQLKRYGGEVGVAAYTIMNALMMLMIMIMVGLTQGMQPIVGYSFGAQNVPRMRSALLYTIRIGMILGAVGFIFGVCLPKYVVGLFNPEPELEKATVTALRIASIMLPLVGFQVVATNFFQSIGKVAQSIFLSLSRQLLLLIPAVLILPHYFGVRGIWLAIPVADFLATLLTLILLWFQFKHFRTSLQQ